MIETVIDIAKEAGKILLKHYKTNYKIQFKDKKGIDPVTAADREADEYIRKRLSEEFPDDKIVSEEYESAVFDYSGRVWFADPLDGTITFVNGKDAFCVMIGLCIDKIPVLGVIYAPGLNELYYAEKDKGAHFVHGGKTKKIQVSEVDNIAEARVYARDPLYKKASLAKKIKETLSVKERISPLHKSLGLRFCSIAKNECDFELNGYSHKWDTCAPQVILEEAGGKVTHDRNVALDYSQDNPCWSRMVIISNKNLHAALLEKADYFLKNK